MALVRVRPKGDPNAPVTEVGEEWLERWPDDFDRVAESDAAPTVTPTDVSVQTEPTPGDGERPARRSF